MVEGNARDLERIKRGSGPIAAVKELCRAWCVQENIQAKHGRKQQLAAWSRLGNLKSYLHHRIHLRLDENIAKLSFTFPPALDCSPVSNHDGRPFQLHKILPKDPQI